MVCVASLPNSPPTHTYTYHTPCHHHILLWGKDRFLGFLLLLLLLFWLVQKLSSLLRCHNLREWQTPISETIPLPAQASSSHKDREGRALFPIQLSCQLLVCLGPYPFIFLAFGKLSVRTSPCIIQFNGRDSQMLPDYFWCQGQSGEGMGLQDPSSGSLDMPQPSACLLMLGMAPHIQGDPGVRTDLLYLSYPIVLSRHCVVIHSSTK